MTLAELFAQVCWMSATALIVAVPVMVLALVFDWLRVPKKFSCLLFALVLFRMLCPLALPSQVSLFNGAFIQDVQQQAVASLNGYSGDYESHVEGTEEYDRAVAAGITPEPFYDHENGIVYYQVVDGKILPADRAMDTWVPILAKVWLAGMAVFYVLTLLSYLLLKRKLRFAVKLEGNVYVSDRIPSPCVVGYLRPRIYLIPGLSEEEQAHILAHERAHLRAADHWAKLAAWLALGVHWFNLWLWSVHSFYCSQLEGACDERVIRKADDETREAYSQTLLNLSYNRRFRWLNPVSFSEGGTKERVKNVLRYKKPSAALIVLAVAATAVLLVSCGTGGGAQRESGSTDVQNQQSGVSSLVIDHSGTLTEEQLESLAALVADGDRGVSDDRMEWLNCRWFTVFEIAQVDVNQEDSSEPAQMQNSLDAEATGTYELQGWLVFGLGTWVPGIIIDGSDGIAICDGEAYRCTYSLTWDGDAFQMEARTILSEGETLANSVERTMRRQELDEDSVMEQLCGQVGAWFGCPAIPSAKFYNGRRDTISCENGQVTVTEYYDTDQHTGTTVLKFDYAALRNAGKEATDAGVTDVSDWTTQELVRALPTCDGYSPVVTELGTRFQNDPLPILREITALGAEDQAFVCHLLTNYYYLWAQAFTIVSDADAQEWIDTLDQGAEESPAVQETARMIQAEYAAFEAGTNEDTMGDSGWALSGPVIHIDHAE